MNRPYTALRLRWSAAELRARLRRWGVWLATLTALAGAGSSAPLATLAAGLGALALPLWGAARSGGLIWLASLAAHTLIAVAWIQALRPLLWTRSWAECERSLPLSRRQIARTDRHLAALALLPVWLLLGTGLAVLGAAQDPLPLPTVLRAVLALLLSQALAWAGAAALMNHWRQRAVGARARPLRPTSPWHRPWRRAGHPTGHPPLHLSAVRALGLIPLWRGPAQRCGGWLAAGLLGLLGAAALPLRWPAALPWWLALWGAAALVWWTRLAALLRDELDPLGQIAAQQLPLSAPQLQRRLRWSVWALAALPIAGMVAAAALGALASTVGGTGAGTTAPPDPARLRPAVLLAWGATAGLAAGAALHIHPRDAAAHAARWGLALAVLTALASEVLR